LKLDKIEIKQELIAVATNRIVKLMREDRKRVIQFVLDKIDETFEFRFARITQHLVHMSMGKDYRDFRNKKAYEKLEKLKDQVKSDIKNDLRKELEALLQAKVHNFTVKDD